MTARRLLYLFGAFLAFISLSVLFNKQGDISDQIFAGCLLIVIVVFGGDDLLSMWRERIKRSPSRPSDLED